MLYLHPEVVSHLLETALPGMTAWGIWFRTDCWRCLGKLTTTESEAKKKKKRNLEKLWNQGSAISQIKLCIRLIITDYWMLGLTCQPRPNMDRNGACWLYLLLRVERKNGKREGVVTLIYSKKIHLNLFSLKLDKR